MPKSELNNVNSHLLVYYGDKGLAMLIGKKKPTEYKQLREIHLYRKDINIPRFPAHREETGNTYRYFYIRSEVEKWFVKYGKLLDKQNKDCSF